MKKKLRAMFLAMCFVMAIVPISSMEKVKAAAVHEETIDVSEDGDYPKSCEFEKKSGDIWNNIGLKDTDKNNWKIKIKNTSEKYKTIKIRFSFDISEGELDKFNTAFASSEYHSTQTYVYGFDKYGEKDKCTKDWVYEKTFTLPAGENKEINVLTYTEDSTTACKFTIKADINVTSVAEEDIPGTSDKPQVVIPGKTYEQSGNNNFFTYTASEVSIARLTIDGKSVTMTENSESVDYKTGTTIMIDKGETMRWKVSAGGTEATYSIKWDIEPYDYGSVALTWPGGENSIIAGTPAPYNLVFTNGKNFGEKNNARILSTSWTDMEGNMVPKDAIAGDKYNAVKPGRFNVTVLYGYSAFSNARIDAYKQQVFTVDVTPATPPVKNVTPSGTHNSLKIKFDSDGNYIYGSPIAQIYLNGNWVDMDGNQKSGLKDNTTYKFRVVGCTPAKGGAPELRSAPSQEFSATTASKQKPAIKSVKVKKVKYVYHKGSWSGGYWVGGDWIPKKWIKPFYTTNITLQVKLKKKIPGSNSVNVFAKAGKATAYRTKVGKGLTSFTVDLSVMGKYKGNASVNVQSSSDKAGLIVGPRSATKKVKIKK